MSDTASTVSPSSSATLVSVSSSTMSNSSKPAVLMGDAERAARIRDYPDAFKDTCGLSKAGFVYKTGAAWPWREPDLATKPYVRKLHPVSHSHPIRPAWSDIVEKIKAHFEQNGLRANIIAGLGFGNKGSEVPFCDLLVIVGIPWGGFEFASVKAAAVHAQETILVSAGFADIQVAVREWDVHLFSASPKLPSLNPEVNRNIPEIRHLFSSNPGLAVALAGHTSFEGTVGAYFCLDDDSDTILALTCCHVACPFRAENGVTVAETSALYSTVDHAAPQTRTVDQAVPLDNAVGQDEAAPRPETVTDGTALDSTIDGAAALCEGIIALGSGAYGDGMKAITKGIDRFQTVMQSEESVIQRIEARLGMGPDLARSKNLKEAKKEVARMKTGISKLNNLHDWAEEHLGDPGKRYIGRVYCADPIKSSSSDRTSAYTIDWALVKLHKDALEDGFTGNQVFVGGNISSDKYREHMSSAYPLHGLLQISGIFQESDISDVGSRVPVVKNGMATGTTLGWLNGLTTFVRRAHHPLFSAGIDLATMETTIVPEDAMFSDEGDSGASILVQEGAMVGIINSGNRVANDMDLTFATAAHQLMPHIQAAVPGARLYPAVSPTN